MDQCVERLLTSLRGLLNNKFEVRALDVRGDEVSILITAPQQAFDVRIALHPKFDITCVVGVKALLSCQQETGWIRFTIIFDRRKLSIRPLPDWLG